ncbi:Pyruvate/2-oxoglutarate dehydrogenase complex dehydrogenase (E1) component-like protein [Sulfolobus islandicus M.14.25]|uniref:2-oxoacid oxidoreductase (ferredoxin) n=1 Tax=Saccharolobus islandicus (strain M.14.25 / Kamchatka \|nr:pyruvate dehydrogenase [Sulfolobus islandicus]ACP39252.1 Pyruvate/2-oxoglutarate dehydrogenase complex dehydrogenase (E1) component-like protein [Sulfolobus islandicus M.14.25]
MKIRGIAQAISEAIKQEMERNDRIVVLGEDVTYWGAVFGFTMGLFEKFDRKRVFDTPIAEQTFMGMAVEVGLSLRFHEFVFNPSSSYPLFSSSCRLRD